MIARSSFGRLARTVFIRSRYLVTVRTLVWNWCLSVAIQQASAKGWVAQPPSAVHRLLTVWARASRPCVGPGRAKACLAGWRRVAMIDYKVNSNSHLPLCGTGACSRGTRKPLPEVIPSEVEGSALRAAYHQNSLTPEPVPAFTIAAWFRGPTAPASLPN